MKTNISLILILCLLLGACKNGNASSQSKSETPQDTIKAIKMPAIPQMMTAPEQRADFLAKHYWDNVNFADTNYIHHPEVTEQAWADYCDLLNHVPLETAQQAMRNVIDRTNVVHCRIRPDFTDFLHLNHKCNQAFISLSARSCKFP